MAKRVIRISDQAYLDYRAIIRTSRLLFGDDQANSYRDAMGDALRNLAGFPDIGRRRTEISPGLFSMVVGAHIVYYRVSDDAISVRRILHQRQQPDGLDPDLRES